MGAENATWAAPVLILLKFHASAYEDPGITRHIPGALLTQEKIRIINAQPYLIPLLTNIPIP